MIHRRDAMIRLGTMSAAGLNLPQLLASEQTRTRSKTKARACINIFLWGGPPQQDMWDMKPDAPEGIRSEFGTIETVTPGIRICDRMPLLAKQTNKIAFIRSLTHPSNNHEPSVYRMLTGRINNSLAVPRNARSRTDFPNFGSVLASSVCSSSEVPPFVTIPRPIGHDGVTYSGTHAGFLGPKFDPVERAPAKNSGLPETHPIDLPSELDQTRIQARFGLLKLLEQQDDLLQKGRGNDDRDIYREQALKMLNSSTVRQAFNLERESPKVRDRYGRNEYGECFLLCRRLIEAGVRIVSFAWVYITKTGVVSNVWDTHGGTGALGGISGFAMLKAPYCLPPLDQGLSALLEDLDLRGLLETTLVSVCGEFGRTPKINSNAGREHWGAAQTALLAGGGIRGGQVYGKTDRIAAYPTENPVTPEDWLATLYHAMGVSPDSHIVDRLNRPHRLIEGQPLTCLFG
ncbi:MAG: DUF1501 domain-containing protein [Gemmataceae bacterium]|jgi:hypothetical protein|nr:DUF1501 domain-containing protein [Gemmataceae bacterium]